MSTPTEKDEVMATIISSVRLPDELVVKARDELEMHGATLANLIKVALGATIGLSRDEALRRYGSVQGRPRKIAEPTESNPSS